MVILFYRITLKLNEAFEGVQDGSSVDRCGSQATSAVLGGVRERVVGDLLKGKWRLSISLMVPLIITLGELT